MKKLILVILLFCVCFTSYAQNPTVINVQHGLQLTPATRKVGNVLIGITTNGAVLGNALIWNGTDWVPGSGGTPLSTLSNIFVLKAGDTNMTGAFRVETNASGIASLIVSPFARSYGAGVHQIGVGGGSGLIYWLKRNAVDETGLRFESYYDSGGEFQLRNSGSAITWGFGENDGVFRTSGFRMTTGDTTNFVLTANGAGLAATWKAASAGGSSLQHIDLDLSMIVTPDGTGTTNNPATPEKVVSSGTQTANSPKVTYNGWLFNPTNTTHVMWQFRLPDNYVSGGTLKGIFSNKGTSGAGVVWKAAPEIGIVGVTDMDSAVFNTVVVTNVNPPTTTGVTTNFTIPLNMTDAAAGRPVVVFVGRDVDHASDTNASSQRLEYITFEYSN